MSLRKSTQRYLESELSNYNYFDKDIARVRDEVLNPWSQQDTNIGGDRVQSNVSVTEIKAIRVVNDRRLSQLARMKSAIEVYIIIALQKLKNLWNFIILKSLEH